MKKIFLLMAFAFPSGFIMAQSDSTENTLDEVVVTANKYPNKTSVTGKVVTVINKQQLEQSGGKDLAQILTEQAGVYIGGANSNPGKDKSIYLRGARIDHTLICIDGVPVYDASGIGSNFDIRNLSISSIERIEILKGSQSTLYGSDAIAGVINIILKKAENKKINGSGLLSYGSLRSFRAAAGVNGRKDKIDYTINYGLQTTKGISEATTTDAEKDGYTQNNLIASLGVKATEHLHIHPYIRLTKIKGDIDQGAFADELDYSYSQDNFQAGIKNVFSYPKMKLTLLYNFNTTNREFIDDSIKSRNGFDTYSRGQYKGNEHFIDAFAYFHINEKIKLTTGVDFRKSKTDQDFFSTGFFGPYSSKYSSDSLKQSQTGLYASLNVNSNKGFNVELGSRVNIHSEYGSHYVFNFNPSYLINNQIKLFGNLSSAYRTPSLYQLFSEYGNKNLKPETAITGEVGLQYFSSDKKLNSRAVIFNRHVSDVIFFYFNNSTFQSQYINQDKQKDKGIELETTYQPINNLTIKTFFSYVTGSITTKTGTGKDTSYFNLLRRPKNSFGLNLSYRINKQFFISTNLSAFGKREDAYFNLQTFLKEDVVLKSYMLWDLYAEYLFPKNKFRAFADFKNITNSKYTEISGFNTLRFNATGGIRFNF